MTPEKWRTASDIDRMMRFVCPLDLEGEERKQMLFGVACCRRIAELIGDRRLEKAVEIAEQFGEGRTTPGKFELAGEQAANAQETLGDNAVRLAAAGAVMGLMVESRPEAIASAVVDVVRLAADARRARAEKAYQAGLLRDLFGNPSRLHALFGEPFCPVTVERAWLSWNNGAVRRLAETIYEERWFQRMPALADALEAAGCCDEAILAHCRGRGPHARGCWVLDVLLGWESDGEWELTEEEDE